ncbi:FecCD family ABC transporter permease [Brevibacillus dissolubilis]|uniref:FecCD family ABC transporter permease n=1 Tax=Brevibacillus dissolubilis TaxID=1844116 RepID=UPI003F65AB6F
MKNLLGSTPLKLGGLFVCLVLLLAGLIGSVIFGVVDTSWHVAIDAYTQFDGSNEHIVIREVRVPRALIAGAVGASLAIAGALLQAMTRNPLADVGIFGINAGASFAIVFGAAVFAMNSLGEFTTLSFIGAALSGVLVYFLGALGREGITPLKLTLAGAAVTAMFSSFTHAILVTNEQALNDVLFWLAGSVAGRKLEMLTGVFPYMLLAWIVAFLMARPINTFMMGEDVAKGLGQRTVLVKALAGLLIVLLSACSVAVSGPIGFIGLVTPHLARYLIGSDTRWVLVYSGFLGAILLLFADILGRFIAMPGEVPIGVMTALMGAPFFIYVVRKGLVRA